MRKIERCVAWVEALGKANKVRLEPVSKQVEKRIRLIASFRRKPEPSFSLCFLKLDPGFRRDDD